MENGVESLQFALKVMSIVQYCCTPHSSLFVEVECRVLEAPEGGSVKLTGLMVGSTATYMCSGGYVLEGVQVRTCLKDGTWSEDEPRCRR